MVAAGQADAFAAMAGMHAQRRVERPGAVELQLAAARQCEWLLAIPVCAPRRREGFAAHTGVQQVAPAAHRSEEHTSELQSLMRISYAVFCLQKKKINSTTKPTYE